MKREEIRVRDPFILLHDGLYYMYCTTGQTTLGYYYSRDLENWEYGGIAFEIPNGFWAYKDVWAAELSDDLVSVVGTPVRLFASDEAPISKATPHQIFYEGKNTVRYGSDAPFVQKLSDGRLLLTWSPYLNGNYVVLGVISPSGHIQGPWEHVESALYDNNGGHAMFFRDIDGELRMCIHAPECPPLERARIFDVGEKDGKFVIFGEI